MKLLAFLLVASLAMTTAAEAEVYKWVDDDGNIHFTDTPPPRQKTEEVNIHAGPSSSALRDPASSPAEADRALCEKAISNLSSFSTVWERNIRAKMPGMEPADRASAEEALRELKADIQAAKKDMSQCTTDLDAGNNRSIAECIANAPNADAGMYCVL